MKIRIKGNSLRYRLTKTGVTKLAANILIENDFISIDNTYEDQSDNYPNPQLTCK